MAAPRPWTVTNPGPLTQRGPHLWTVDDEVPGLRGASRTMSIVRHGSDELLFFNAVPLPDDTLAAVRALGRPAQLVVPNQFHALDAAAFAERLGLAVYAPGVALPTLSLAMTCRPIDELPRSEALEVFGVDGFKTHEVVVHAREAVVVADVVTNAPHGRGFNGLVMRLVGFTGEVPKLPKPVQLRVQRDAAKVRALLERLAALPGLELLVPSHGPPVQGAAAALRAVAATL